MNHISGGLVFVIGIELGISRTRIVERPEILYPLILVYEPGIDCGIQEVTAGQYIVAIGSLQEYA